MVVGEHSGRGHGKNDLVSPREHPVEPCAVTGEEENHDR